MPYAPDEIRRTPDEIDALMGRVEAAVRDEPPAAVAATLTSIIVDRIASLDPASRAKLLGVVIAELEQAY